MDVLDVVDVVSNSNLCTNPMHASSTHPPPYHTPHTLQSPIPKPSKYYPGPILGLYTTTISSQKIKPQHRAKGKYQGNAIHIMVLTQIRQVLIELLHPLLVAPHPLLHQPLIQPPPLPLLKSSLRLRFPYMQRHLAYTPAPTPTLTPPL